MKKGMSKTMATALVSALVLSTVLGGCGKKNDTTENEGSSLFEQVSTTDADSTQDAQPETAQEAQPEAPQETQGEIQTSSGRQDGERFEDVIILEGMEETVKYEHVVNKEIGFEMDYDYESFTRSSQSGSERFISVYDDQNAPENYLEITHRSENAEDVVKSVSEELSKDFDIIEESSELDGVGSCTYIDASEAKNGGGTPDQMEGVYIIPTSDGCIVATMHYSFESAEGFGRRFVYILNTLKIVEK